MSRVLPLLLELPKPSAGTHRRSADTCRTEKAGHLWRSIPLLHRGYLPPGALTICLSQN
jgi:hypothetical protein